MKHTDEFLERIRQTEVDNLDHISRFVPGMTIETTAEFVGSKRLKEDIVEKTFKPDNYFKYAVLTFAFGVLVLTVKETFFKSNANTIGLVFGYVFSGILIFTAIRQFFYDMSLNYVIHLDNKGISIDDKLFEWNNIYETAILTKPAGNSKIKYLIIAFNDRNSYEKFELTHFINLNFWGFSSTLSKYIEYFKLVQIQNKLHTTGGFASGGS